MKQVVKKYNKWKSLLLLVLGIVILSFTIDLPYYVEIPGTSEDIRHVLRVNNEEDVEEGSYDFVTVSVSPANLAKILYAWVTDYTDIYSEKDLTGGSTDDEYQRINQFYMETSQNTAKYQGLTKAGQNTKIKYLGVYVLDVTKDSTFKNVLHLADTVTAINGKEFQSSQELIDYVSSLALNSKVQITYYNDGKKCRADGKVIRLKNGKNGIGIGLVDHMEVVSDIPIEFATEGIGGPSAGLMFSLAIYTQLADPTLRNGKVVAGTGSIDQDGKVGEVGGIDKKVIAAAKSGSDIFFVPNNPLTKAEISSGLGKNNYQVAQEAAKAIHTNMKIVPVTSLQDAIDYLQSSKIQPKPNMG